MELEELKKRVTSRVIDFDDSFSEEMKAMHTNIILSASSEDVRSKIYLKEMIRLRLIQQDLKYLDKKLADPLVEEIFGENWGIGVLEPYDLDHIDEIMVVGTTVSIEEKGKIRRLPVKFKSETELLNVMRRLQEYDNSADISATNPTKSWERRNGDRVTISIPPVAKYPTLNIRKFDSFLPVTSELISSGTINQEMVDYLDILIKGKANIKIIGEQGSGKSTFLKWALGFCQEGERVGSLETDFELNPEKLYPHIDFVQLRERKQIGKTLSGLFEVMLRQNLKRIILGEMRNGLEVYQFLYACNRGMSGSIGTSHSMSAERAIDDDASMVVEANLSRDKEATKRDIANAVDIVLTFRKLPSGKRVCYTMEEVIAKENNYEIRELFRYNYDETSLESGVHTKENEVSTELKKKLEAYGIEKNEIKRVLG